MFFPRFVPLVAALGFCCAVSGCYYTIPVAVEYHSQTKRIAALEASQPHAKTGALKHYSAGSGTPAAMNTVIDAYNGIMVGPMNLVASRQAFSEQSKRYYAGYRPAIPAVENLERTLVTLNDAALSGSLDEKIATRVKNAVTVLNDFFKIQKQTIDFFEYTNDIKGQQGQELMRQYGDAIGKSAWAMQVLGEDLFAAQDKETDRRIAAYTSKNDALGVSTEQAMRSAASVVSCLNGIGTFQALSALDRKQSAATEMAAMKSSLAELARVLDANTTVRDRSEGIDAVIGALNDMATDFDTYRNSSDKGAFNLMMGHYEQAVTAYNNTIK